MVSPYVADAGPASSGVMTLRYAAAAAPGERRAFAAPASLDHAVLSRGVEERTGFASLAARRTPGPVVGRELVAALGELRRRDPRPDPELPVGRAAAPLDRFKDLYV